MESYKKMDEFPNYRFYENGNIYNEKTEQYIRLNGQQKKQSVLLLDKDGYNVRRMASWLIMSCYSDDEVVKSAKNNGKKIKGYKILFLDGDSTNCAFNNLKLIQSKKLEKQKSVKKNIIAVYVNDNGKRGKLIATFPTIKETSKQTGVKSPNINYFLSTVLPLAKKGQYYFRKSDSFNGLWFERKCID